MSTPPHHPATPTPGPTTPLERRYRRLLRAYPADYRAARGDEIVGTYLDLAAPGRSWPSPADAADLLRAGLRERLRGYGASGLAAGLPLAATLALHTLLALAASLLVRVEFADPGPAGPVERVGPVQTLGAVVWCGWLLVGLAAAVLPGRWARRAALGALLLTLLVPAAARLTGQPRPPLFILVPATALGLAALALPTRPGWTQRLLPLITAGTGVAVGAAAWQGGDVWLTSYRSTPDLLAAAGGLLFGLAVLIAIGHGITGDDRGLWVVLLLVVPAGLLGANQLAQVYWDTQGGGPSWWMLASTAGTVTLAGTVLLITAIAGQVARHRTTRRPIATGACPTCGRPMTSGQ